MSNWIHYELDVLAGCPTEINQIAERLKQPSSGLVDFVRERDGGRANEIAEGLRRLFQFEATINLGYVNPSFNRARRFTIAFKSRSYGLIDSHLFGISQEYPSAVFLLTYRDSMGGYGGKKVIRGGDLVRHVHDGDQKMQSLDWVLIDIFPPFLAEYYNDLPFGSLWQEWVAKLASAIGELKDESSVAVEGAQTADAQPRRPEGALSKPIRTPLCT
jgi:hypothetical protein